MGTHGLTLTVDSFNDFSSILTLSPWLTTWNFYLVFDNNNNNNSYTTKTTSTTTITRLGRELLLERHLVLVDDGFFLK